mmetsp:Transcript_16127/g.33749  ORF Transcript_16127/g.33749 Transcript_16127/m.33749 type:complete len:157 (+) Transcript_16127:471-941(+)
MISFRQWPLRQSLVTLELNFQEATFEITAFRTSLSQAQTGTGERTRWYVVEKPMPITFVRSQTRPTRRVRPIACHGLKAAHWAIGLPGSSNAEATLASRMDVHVTSNIGVVQPLVKRGRNSGNEGIGHHRLRRLVGLRSLKKGSCGTDKGEESQER